MSRWLWVFEGEDWAGESPPLAPSTQHAAGAWTQGLSMGVSPVSQGEQMDP